MSALSNLQFSFHQQILWENRRRGDTGERCLVTIDGVDFMIPEPTPWSSHWYSHKFNWPGLRYELAVAIKMVDIVAYNGPFECGRWPDIKIFRSRLKGMLRMSEKVVADRGYKGDRKVCLPDKYNNEEHKKAMNKARARHKTING